jgi:hypothetical protein
MGREARQSLLVTLLFNHETHETRKRNTTSFMSFVCFVVEVFVSSTAP